MAKGLLVDFWGTLFYPSITIEEYHRLRARKVAESLSSSGYNLDVEKVYNAYLEARRIADEIRNHSLREVDLTGELVLLLNILKVNPTSELLASLREAYMYPYLYSLSLAPGAPDLLLEARRLGYKIILASNTMSGEYTVLLLRKNGMLTLFDYLGFSDEICFRKPHPRFYSWIIHQTGINPQESVFIGDEEGDILGAKSFGMRTIAFTGFHDYMGKTEPDYTARTMQGIHELLG